MTYFLISALVAATTLTMMRNEDFPNGIHIAGSMIVGLLWPLILPAIGVLALLYKLEVID